MAFNTYEHHAIDDALPKSALSARLNSFPALMALSIQLGIAVLLALCLWAASYAYQVFFQAGMAIPLGLVFLLQGIGSSAASHQLGMARWWNWIHLCFPLMVWLMLIFTIPEEVYLIGFIATASIYWTTFRTQVPYYPSGLPIWQKVSALTHQYQAQYGANINIIEIGSGLGGFARYIAKTHPEAKVAGIEVAPLPWLLSRVLSFYKHSKARFQLGSYNKLQFAEYDIVFAYLSPAAMPALWEKSQQEMRKGCLLISLEFPVPGLTPTQHMPADYQSPDLYIYECK